MNREELYNLERDYFNSLRESDKKDLTDYAKLNNIYEDSYDDGVNCIYVNCKKCILNGRLNCISNDRVETERLLVEWKKKGEVEVNND